MRVLFPMTSHGPGKQSQTQIWTFRRGQNSHIYTPFFITKSEFLCNPLLGVTILHFANLVPSHLLLIGWRNSVFRLMLVSIIMIMFWKIWGQKLGVTRDRGGPFCTKRGRPRGQKAQWLLQNNNLLIVEGSQCMHCWHLAIGYRIVACLCRNIDATARQSWHCLVSSTQHLARIFSVAIALPVYVNLFLNTLQTGDD